jgi:glycosyltransferase involved in cell wall biosynthesis
LKILVISARVPAAGRNGDQVLAFARLAYLARNHIITVICFGKGETDLAAKRTLESLGINVRMVRRRPIAAMLSIVRAVLDGTPFQCALNRSAEFSRIFAATVKDFKPDAVYCVMVRMIQNAGSYSGPLFVDMIDSMSLNFFRRSQMASGIKRAILRIERERIRKFERAAAQRAALSFVVSEIDRREIGESNVEVIPLGIDTTSFTKDAGQRSGPVIAFTGNMFYSPNVDAALWFHEHCWEGIRRVVPDVRLVIAGSNPDRRLLTLAADESIAVTGRVASLAAVLNAATVAIAPMQSGSGMQFKILEAMACGVPVVATTLGRGDIAAVPGEHILIADSPATFIDAVVALLTSEGQRQKVGDAGLEYVRKYHDLEALNERFERTCEWKLGGAAPLL